MHRFGAQQLAQFTFNPRGGSEVKPSDADGLSAQEVVASKQREIDAHQGWFIRFSAKQFHQTPNVQS
jgi:hypothetical protein